jgi:hypothetical protein
MAMTFDPKEVVRVLMPAVRPLQNLTILSIDLSPGPIVTILTTYYKMDETEAAQVALELKNMADKSRLFADSVDGRHFEFISDNKAEGSNYKRLNSWKYTAAGKLTDTFTKKRFTSRKTGEYVRPSQVLTFAHGAGQDRKPGTAYSSATGSSFRALRLLEEAGAEKEYKFLANLMQDSEEPFINEIRIDYMRSLTTAKGNISKRHVTWLGFEGPSEQLDNSIWERRESQRIEKAFLGYLIKYAEDNATEEYVDELHNLIETEKAKKSKKKASIPKKKVRIVNTKSKKVTKRRKAGAVIPIRDAKGQFTSPMHIQALLNAKIKETVAENMGKGGALVYRTGRFADSVTVDKVMQSRQGALTAYYTYMKAPYQTFERGFKQGSARRDPRKLISASIREIARETLSHKLHIRTRRV